MVRKLCLIYSLNIADWVCTVVLLGTGGYYEANPLMSAAMGDLSLGFLIKCILPAFLLLFVARMYGELGARWFRPVDDFVCFTLALYTALCVVHIVNFMLWNFVG